MANIYDMSDTWNASGTTFTAIKMNVTDTNSASGSLLMDLQVGGSSKFSVQKDGRVALVGGTNFIGSGANGLAFSNSAGSLILQALSFSGLTIPATAGVGFRWYSNTGILYESANTLGQRNGTNAQTFNIYNTYTDASNYERGFMKWNSNVLEIGAEAAGTGTARTISFLAGGANRLSIATTGVVSVSGSEVITSSSITYFGSSTSGFTFRYNNGANSDLLVRFAGTTSSFPAIKRSTTSLQARLADDSAFTNIQGKLTTETAYTAGVTTATGYIVLYDSTGTAYKVPAEAL